ncbi:MAG: NHL repeat-containing protein [Treponema sp.]|nr:NHL repeat-containing protein [Treponema sp.]
MKNRLPGLFPLLLFLFAAPLLFPQAGGGNGTPGLDGIPGEDMNTVRAREEFRIGVQAYHRFAFNEAILSFERALSFRPGEPLILDWLGRSYYRSGFEETALREWELAGSGYGLATGMGILLASKAETVRNRRTYLPVPNDEIRYIESGRYPSKNGDIVLYSQPTAVLPAGDGGAWVVAYGSNEIIKIDVNGIIRDRKRGPINGFDRPYDLVQGSDGRLYLSEFRGGRVSVLSAQGDWQFYIGAKGRGPGQFMGPQNMAIDEEGYLYVADYGNQRISKFDPAGAFILSFGVRIPGFEGFKSLTGLAARNGIIYAADTIARCIYSFDKNGAYQGVFIREGLESPEDLCFLEDGRLLAADANRVLLIDTETAIMRELGVLGNPGRVRITGVDFDKNGNVLAADFKTGEVAIMTRMEDMASGFFVQIDRVVSDNFPLLEVEILVQDRLRRPIVGLGAGNFLLSEQGRTVGEQNFLGASYFSERSDIAVLVERSPATQGMKDDLASALRDISAAGARIVSVVSAEEQPRKESLVPETGSTPSVALEAAARGGAYSPRWRFDLGLRLAATDLLPGEKKRAVVFVGSSLSGPESSTLGSFGFEYYALSELAAYLANNSIAFYAVTLGGGRPGADIQYLCDETGGKVLSLYRNEGIVPEIKTLALKASGYYTLSYRSSLPTDFGRAYLPLDAEVYLMEKSGRDSTGYFPPLE